MEIGEEIIEVLEYLGNKMGIAIDWSSENVMPYIKMLCDKYIDWEIATSIMWIVTALIPFLICTSIFIWSCHLKNDINYYSPGEIQSVTLTFFIVTMVVLLLVALYNSYIIIRCVYFPELQMYKFIMEEIRMID